jgi:hypothetical protein
VAGHGIPRLKAGYMHLGTQSDSSPSAVDGNISPAKDQYSLAKRRRVIEAYIP